jgi:hypothetical protein
MSPVWAGSLMERLLADEPAAWTELAALVDPADLQQLRAPRVAPDAGVHAHRNADPQRQHRRAQGQLERGGHP